MSEKRHVRIKKGANGYTFQVIAANGEPQATSEPYVSEANARRGASDLLNEPVSAIEFTYPADLGRHQGGIEAPGG